MSVHVYVLGVYVYVLGVFVMCMCWVYVYVLGVYILTPVKTSVCFAGYCFYVFIFYVQRLLNHYAFAIKVVMQQWLCYNHHYCCCYGW